MTIPNYHVNIYWGDEDEAWTAEVPDLRWRSKFGSTRGEVLEAIEAVIAERAAIAEANGEAMPPATYVPVPVSRAPVALSPFRVEDYLGTMADAVYYLAVSVHEDSATELIESVRLVGRSPGGKLLAAALEDAAHRP